MAAEEVNNFGIPPKVAFVSHSQFGSSRRPSAIKMRQARDIFRSVAPHVNCDGEMHGDAALLPELRDRLVARQHAGWRRQPAGVPEPGFGQHPVQRAQDHRRARHHHRPDPAGQRLPRARHDAFGHRAPAGEHDRPGRGRSGCRQEAQGWRRGLMALRSCLAG